MTVNRDAWIRLLFTMILSTIIYNFGNILSAINAFAWTGFLSCLLLGGIIWFVAENIFDILHRLWPFSDLPSYIAMVILIGTGTNLGVYYIGEGTIISACIASLIAIVSGVSMAFFYKRNYKRIANDKLKIFQNTACNNEDQ